MWQQPDGQNINFTETNTTKDLHIKAGRTGRPCSAGSLAGVAKSDSQDTCQYTAKTPI